MERDGEIGEGGDGAGDEGDGVGDGGVGPGVAPGTGDGGAEAAAAKSAGGRRTAVPEPSSGEGGAAILPSLIGAAFENRWRIPRRSPSPSSPTFATKRMVAGAG